MISQAELDMLGLSRTSLKVKDPATGNEGYRAAVEVFHQLHCLNLLRQYVYKDYYVNVYSDIDRDDEEGLKDNIGEWRWHALLKSILMLTCVDHCLEAIRINLMCTADIGIFTFRDFPEYGFEKGDYRPDLSTQHTCRNFDAIHQWAVDHTVSWSHDV